MTINDIDIRFCETPGRISYRDAPYLALNQELMTQKTPYVMDVYVLS